MMSEQSLISVIVPVYNVEKYLRPCVESILEQTYKNIEVILVNDGSTDKSKAICLELAEKDKRISYYEKANSGLSDTRNVGLEKAKGEYIAFVDSDDLLAPNAVRTLYELCRKYDTAMGNSHTIKHKPGKMCLGKMKQFAIFCIKKKYQRQHAEKYIEPVTLKTSDLSQTSCTKIICF